MAEEDIYGNKRKYEKFKANLKSFLTVPNKTSKRSYYCRNPSNLKYFKSLFLHFEAKDLSYINRNRKISSFKLILFCVKKDLKDCSRDDTNEILALMHTKNKTVNSKKSFIRDLKHIWRILFPELDEKGRPDETTVPYVVRHVSGKVDVSKKKLRKDKLTWEEFEQIIDYFAKDPRIQAYLTLQLESLVRPQELLYRRIGEIEHYDSYAKVYLSDHCKENPSFLQCIDSYPYVLKWLQVHPQKKDKNAYIFINTGNRNTLYQLTPFNINKMLKKACKDLGIDKPITCYSLKRSGVTLRRLRGDTDLEIQHAARWTSTKQLKTYDMSDQDDALNLALQKRGLIPLDKKTTETPKSKTCAFCGEVAGFAETICPKCRHPLDRTLILNEKKKDEEIQELKETVNFFKKQFQNFKQEVLKDLSAQIFEEINLKSKSKLGTNKK